jgi:hypothetical protein
MRKRFFVTAFLVATLFALALPQSGRAQTKEALVGTWRLVSSKDTTATGAVKDSFGPNPTGLLIYGADGRMSVIITNGGRKPLSSSDYVAAPAQERAEAFATLLAYGGRYTFEGDRVIHHVEVASIQSRVNTDLVRLIVKFEGKRITLRTPPFLRGGVQIAKEELLWERIS